MRVKFHKRNENNDLRAPAAGFLCVSRCSREKKPSNPISLCEQLWARYPDTPSLHAGFTYFLDVPQGGTLRWTKFFLELVNFLGKRFAHVIDQMQTAKATKPMQSVPLGTHYTKFFRKIGASGFVSWVRCSKIHGPTQLYLFLLVPSLANVHCNFPSRSRLFQR